jgi:hypothetical protein
MNQKQLPVPLELAEIVELTERLEKAKDPDPTDVNRLRELATRMPEDLFPDGLPTQTIRQQLIGKMSSGVSQAFMLAETDRLKQDLDFTAAPPLERLLIDHILTLRLRLLHAEAMYNDTVVDKAATLAMGAYRDKLLTTTQTRYLRAIETLVRVRRLARNTPSLQINIAQEGGKQINVQGEVSGQQVP